MPFSEETRQAERKRIAGMAMQMVEERGAEISYTDVLTESGLSRARFEHIFPDYDDLFDAIAHIWLAPHMEVMEQVLASDLPSNRKMYEFIRQRFVISRDRFREDPQHFTMICEMGAANMERVRSYVDLADHYLAELIVQAQADGYFAGLEIDEALSIINQIVSDYTMPESLVILADRLSEEKLARIVDTMFIGLSAEAGSRASGVNSIRAAS